MKKSPLDKPPALIWSLTEPRFIFEMVSHYTARPLFRRLPKGDGHPVMVIPGFLGSDGGTGTLRKVLGQLGYKSYGWGLGQNKTFSHERLAEVAARVEALSQQHGEKISIIGWSMGGIIAREVAKTHPHVVRIVITMGSPISGNFNHTFAYKVYKALNGHPRQEDLDFFATIKNVPPVPCTSIYSKSDGIVAWRNSLQEDTPQSENIRVRASHCGMGVNPSIVSILANRLSQPEGGWRKFDKKNHIKLFPRRWRAARV